MCIFFKQKTAYEMRMSDWSSDVGSSDLVTPLRRTVETAEPLMRAAGADAGPMIVPELMEQHFGNWQGRPCAEVYGELGARHPFWLRDRKSVVSGKSGSVRVDLGGRRNITRKIH